MGFAGVWAWGKAFDAHFSHQALHALAVDGVSPLGQLPGHATGSIKRGLGILLIDQAHQQQIFRAFLGWLVVIARPGKPNQLTLPSQADVGMTGVDHPAFFLNVRGQLFFSASPVRLSTDRFPHTAALEVPRHFVLLWFAHWRR